MAIDAKREENWLLSDNAWVLMSLFVAAFGIRLVFLRIAPNNTTDAWSRFHNAVLWLQNPRSLPPATSSSAWLPFHFWLLGAVLWLTKSEMALRIFTALLGSVTVLFYFEIVKRAFDRQVALVSSLMLAVFGFHIAFSVTTGSEVPTIFFMAGGTYAWLRCFSQPSWSWALFSAVTFSLACLCRFEPWLCAPVLGLLLLDSNEKRSALLKDRRLLWRAAGFGLLASAGAIAWMIFSFMKWGDPLELPHRTMALNLQFRPGILRHSVLFRLLTVPVSLLASMTPVVVGLACAGVWRVFKLSRRPARSLAVLALVLFAFNYWNSIRYEVTQARYTLLYSWLLFPFALEGLRWLGEWWDWIRPRSAIVALVVFFLLWEAGIIVGAAYARPTVADRLSVLSPTVPLHHEMRGLTNWLLQNHSTSTPVILDEFNWDSPNIARFAHLDSAVTFHVTQAHYSDRALMKRDLEQFVKTRHPVFLICSPYGPIGSMWSVDDLQQLSVIVQDQSLQLHLEWQGQFWRVYSLTYTE